MIRVMIVEDEPSTLQRYSSYIEEAEGGFTISARCPNAADALERLHEAAPDVVFTDIRMPGEDGLSLLTRLKDAGWDGLSVIISGHDDFAYARKAIQLTAFDFLLKPVFPEDMRQVLEKLRLRLGERADRPAGFSPPGIDTTGMPAFVRRALSYVENNPDRAVSLHEIAETVFVSPAYLSAAFKKHCGCALSEYVRRCRIAEAKRLIETTEQPLKEIADRLGFPDIAAFTKLFHRMTGSPPGIYRDAARGRRPPHE